MIHLNVSGHFMTDFLDGRADLGIYYPRFTKPEGYLIRMIGGWKVG